MNHASRSLPTPCLAQHSQAAEHNGPAILQALHDVLPPKGLALEIASGTGQHVALFAAGLPEWNWQPSDTQTEAFESIVQWCRSSGVTNVQPPLALDVLSPRWPSGADEFTGKFDVIYCANMFHIAPWSACAGLMQGASGYLAPMGSLITYGPYLELDVPTSTGNLDFSESLRKRNAGWGIRFLDDVLHQAKLAGLQLRERRQMPTNNLLLVFGRAAPSARLCPELSPCAEFLAWLWVKPSLGYLHGGFG